MQEIPWLYIVDTIISLGNSDAITIVSVRQGIRKKVIGKTIVI